MAVDHRCDLHHYAAMRRRLALVDARRNDSDHAESDAGRIGATPKAAGRAGAGPLHQSRPCRGAVEIRPVLLVDE